jgi:hypothetical protein
MVLLFGATLPPVQHMGTAAALRVFVEPVTGVGPVVAFIDAARSRLDGEWSTRSWRQSWTSSHREES